MTALESHTTTLDCAHPNQLKLSVHGDARVTGVAPLTAKEKERKKEREKEGKNTSELAVKSFFHRHLLFATILRCSFGFRGCFSAVSARQDVQVDANTARHT